MYTLTFNSATLKDLWAHHPDNPDTVDPIGRQMYGAIIIPYSGVFTKKSYGSSVSVPKILCPYQVNDIIAIQEQWAMSNSSYVYKIDMTNEDAFQFRPATTMPLQATRMYGRIVSVTPWIVTPEIYRNYLSTGSTADRFPGAAKVIKSYDKGNQLLSSSRSKFNKTILAKSSQPTVSDALPLQVFNVLYRLDQPFTPTLKFRLVLKYKYPVTSGYVDAYTHADYTREGPSSLNAISFGDGTWNGNYLLDEHERGTRREIDWNYGSWYVTSLTDAEYQISTNKEHLMLIGPTTWDQKYNRNEYFLLDDSDEWNAISLIGHYYNYYAFLKGKPRPRYAYYESVRFNPNLYLYCWLISAYLCDENGNIFGNYMK